MFQLFGLGRPAVLCAALTGLVGLQFHVQAQDEVPLQNKDMVPIQRNEPLEIETLEISQSGALPAKIHRAAGKFILLIVDRSPDHATSYLVVRAPQKGDAQVVPAPLLRVDSRKADPRKHRLATVVLAPPGEFDLKSEINGRVLCKFIFD